MLAANESIHASENKEIPCLIDFDNIPIGYHVLSLANTAIIANMLSGCDFSRFYL